ncbi:unnamed protein product, partial [Gongylonema pulchrum]|uniref:Secreted protein n=1 Tax=Gongylonema pulchrum TaxID=637853 RepID=A0A183DWY8_9BILA
MSAHFAAEPSQVLVVVSREEATVCQASDDAAALAGRSRSCRSSVPVLSKCRKREVQFGRPEEAPPSLPGLCCPVKKAGAAAAALPPSRCFTCSTLSFCYRRAFLEA